MKEVPPDIETPSIVVYGDEPIKSDGTLFGIFIGLCVGVCFGVFIGMCI